MNKLRYINLGKVPPDILAIACELHKLLKLQDFTLVSLNPTKKVITPANMAPLEDFIKVDEIPSDVEVRRLFYPNNPTSRGVLCWFPDKTLFMVYYYRELEKKVAFNMIVAAVIKALKKYNIVAFGQGNDLFFEKEGKKKKFAGIGFTDFGEWKRLGLVLSLDFEFELARQIYKLDVDKMAKKGEIKDISEIIGGLWSINPDIKLSELGDEIAGCLADRLGFSLLSDKFTPEEWNKIDGVKEIISSPEWNFNAKRPDMEGGGI